MVLNNNDQLFAAKYLTYIPTKRNSGEKSSSKRSFSDYRTRDRSAVLAGG
ncbi:MAG: hypothetical protein IKX35_08265 [Bacteroidales bacterium]|nr:hypothetical protein [Bacteroidales bacterium]MBR5082416.1 hypothetical protein [Bacteroidales bacterium]